jgi:hypothetical protein
MVPRAEAIVNETHGLSEIAQYKALRTAFDDAVITAIIAYCHSSRVDPRLATVAKEECLRRYAHYKDSGLFENAEDVVKDLAQALQP